MVVVALNVLRTIDLLPCRRSGRRVPQGDIPVLLQEKRLFEGRQYEVLKVTAAKG